MSSIPPYLPATTASASWMDSSQQLHLHVFTTDGYTVTERWIGPNSNGWANGTLNQPAGAISATAWTDGNGGHIRVYCTSDDATVEWCLDGNESAAWYQGQYTLS